MKILLIGATGQIGTELSRQLLSTNHDIAIMVRKQPPIVPGGLRVIVNAEFDQAAFRAALRGIDHVIYGVGLPEQFTLDEDIFDRTNVQILEHFIDAMLESDVSQATYISTFEIFETINGKVSEAAVMRDYSHLTPYYKSMFRAYNMITERLAARGTHLTTIHPSAVYGGKNTGNGITDYLENIITRRIMRIPFIIDGNFPVVHAKSLANAIVRSIGGKSDSYIISDSYTSLREIAHVARRYSNCLIPLGIPVQMARVGASFLEAFARITRGTPILSHRQIDYISASSEPVTDKARKALGWDPMTLDEGIKDFTERITHAQ